MAEGMWVKGRIAGEQAGIEFHDASRTAVAEAGAVVVQKEGGIGGVSDWQIFFQCGGGFRAVGSLALLAAFTANEDPAFGHVEVGEIEADQFADAEAAAVEQLEQEEVAFGMWTVECVGGDTFDERVGLLGGGHGGDALRAFRRADQLRYVGRDGSFAKEKFE